MGTATKVGHGNCSLGHRNCFKISINSPTVLEACQWRSTCNIKSIVQASIHVFRALILNGLLSGGDSSVPKEDSGLWMLKFSDPLCTM